MKKNLKDYILHLDKWIPKKICNKIIKELNKDKNWYRHNWTDSKSYKKYNIEKKELYTNNTQQLTDVKKLYDLVWKGLEKYIVVEKLGGEEFKGWVGFHQIRFNRYNKDQSIKKHVDHIHSLFEGEKRGIPILSIVCVLNDNYKGGEFIMFDDYEIKFKAGDLIIFPSVFLYPHLVKSVKKGTRYSFVSWAW
tara:strand:- start:53 stop:628 length:576 start_codon:yes stop_codon:yes gene_type:complete